MLLRRGAVKQSYICATTFSVYLDHLPVTVNPDRRPLVGQQIHVCRLDALCWSWCHGRRFWLRQSVPCLLLNVNVGDLNMSRRCALLPNSTSCLHTPTSAGSQMGKWLPSATRTGEWTAVPYPPHCRPSASGDQWQHVVIRLQDNGCGSVWTAELSQLGHILSLWFCLTQFHHHHVNCTERPDCYLYLSVRLHVYDTICV